MPGSAPVHTQRDERTKAVVPTFSLDSPVSKDGALSSPLTWEISK